MKIKLYNNWRFLFHGGFWFVLFSIEYDAVEDYEPKYWFLSIHICNFEISFVGKK
jgi:hypothetical protein